MSFSVAHSPMNKIIALLAAGLFSTCALAQVTVTEPWIRATVPRQDSAGAFMRLQSAQPARLVAVSTPAAKHAEIHEMAMEGHTMSMRRVEAVALPAGRAVNLTPGSYHVMLYGLKRQLKEGDSVELTLVVQDAQGKPENVKVTAQVKPIAYSAPPAH